VDGVEVLDQHEGHARVGGQVIEQFGEGLQASGGGPDSNYGRGRTGRAE
jgi:hypothetical protein